MPYKLEEDNGGYYVVNEQTGKRKNKTPISKERAVKYMRALYAVEGGAEMKEHILTAFKRNYDANTGGGVDRDKLPASDFVDPERRRFPIVKASDVMDAVHSYGRASPKIPFDQFKARVIAIAKRKGFVSALPKDWGVEEKEVTTKSIGSTIESSIHSQFTSRADDWYGQEFITRDERIILSSAIGDALEAFVKRVEKDAPQLYSENISDRADNFARPDMPSMTNEAWKEAQPALMVYKDANGADRWVLFSSNAFRDRDGEIVSLAALEADVARADKEQNYGPLRWWHVGKPDPVTQTAGPGLDIGKCDFNAMHGRTLIESGTFDDPRIGEALKEIAPLLQVSIGYFHPKTEPDSAGVFHKIKRFERSILPKGRASNPFTEVSIIQKSNGGKDMLSDKIKAFMVALKDPELVKEILAKADMKELNADELKIDFKAISDEIESETPPAAPVVEAVIEAAPVVEAEPEPEIEEDYQPTIADLSPDAFAGLLAEAMDKAMEPHRKELADMQASMKTKDDSEAALRESLELQAKTIQTLKSQLDELTGSQPRAATKGYRDSQSETTVVKDDSRVKGKQPTVDPEFIKMFQPGQ